MRTQVESNPAKANSAPLADADSRPAQSDRTDASANKPQYHQVREVVTASGDVIPAYQ